MCCNLGQHKSHTIMTKLLYAGIFTVIGAIIVNAYLLKILFVLCGMVSKLTCSLAFVSKRQSPIGNFPEVDSMSYFSRFTNTTFDHNKKIVTTSVLVPILGAITSRSAHFLNEQLGCQHMESKSYDVVVPSPPVNHTIEQSSSDSDTLSVAPQNAELEKLLDNDFANTSVETRTLLIVQDNKIIAERYAKGFHKDMPQHGWSMGKSILNALIGILQHQGKLDVNDAFMAPEWIVSRNITWDNALKMSTGLEWAEDYSDIFGDAVLMLFESFDNGHKAANKPMTHEPGSHFMYSSGTSNLISRQIRKLLGSEEYWKFPHKELFNKIGMPHTAYELDPSGTFVASSYGYYTARELANFGLLYVNDGVWNGERV
jgi:hypothetical protein